MTTAPLASPVSSNDSLLRRALLGNVAFSTLCGLVFLGAADPVTRLLGSLPVWLVPAIGAGLLLFAARVFLVARRLPASARVVPQIIAGDVAWVLGSLALLLWRPVALSTTGLWLIVDVALIVAAFAFFQFLGLRRLHS